MFAWWISWTWVLLLLAPTQSRGAVWATGGRLPPLPQQEVAVEGMGGSAVRTMGRKGPQRFATQPAPQIAVVGSTAVLPCRVINKVGHLQWTKDGFGLGTERDLFGFSRYAMIGSDDEGDFSLRIHPVLLEDDGVYQCQVSASEGVPGIRTGTARLTVYVPPEPPIVRPPILDTTAGMTVDIECESRGGRPPPEIQWRDDSRRESLHHGVVVTTEPLPDRKRVTVRSRLSFKPKRSHHNSTITCLSSNQALSSPLTATVRLRVQFPPEVQLSVQPRNLVEGDDASFVCEASANPASITYRWFHNSQEIPNETYRTLLLHKISRDLHQDAISCEVSNTVGTSKKTQSVHVQYGPVFRVLPRDVEAKINKEVLLKCDVVSNPPSSIVWHQEGSDKIIGSGPELRVVVSEATAGVYRCVSTVRGFPDLTGRLRVLVEGPPTIVSSSEQEGRMGDTVNLECHTLSVPKPIKITWTYKGREIDLSDPRYEVVEDEQDQGLRNILVIHDADTEDFGAYNCSVVNEHGIARKQIRLNREKTIPVLLLVCGLVAVIVIVVVVISLVLCNKRHSTLKGSPVPKKPPAVSVVPGADPPVVANMYSASSESKLDEENTPTPTPTPTPIHRQLDLISSAEETKIQAAHQLNRLSVGDPIGNNFVTDMYRGPSYLRVGNPIPNIYAADMDRDMGLGYVPFVDYGGRDYSPQQQQPPQPPQPQPQQQHQLPEPSPLVNGGRRASLSGDLHAISPPRLPVAVATSDFCTLRRGARRTMETLNGGIMTPAEYLNLPGTDYRDLGLRHTGVNGISPGSQRPPPNGVATPTLTRYNPRTPNYGSPPPPPYPRNTSTSSKVGSPRGNPPVTSPSNSHPPNQNYEEYGASPEARYIFSPEAIMKPGTLV
ncbi:irregular chiasm C-roughest protein-like isoform X2 [Oratosquilla oratoria]|uniref:irregular chiasm C-roughest protein-like isoform X2 n=1 Tax=Oratosquilla oratoria TaxID=337810 RepID=UPI003F76D4EF